MWPMSPAQPCEPRYSSPLHDDPGADAGADLDEDEVLAAAAEAGGELAERHHVHVVVDPHRHAEAREALAARRSRPSPA